MEMQSDETRLEQLVEQTARYHNALLEQNVPTELAQMLVRDWHRLQIERDRVTMSSTTERLISELIREIRESRTSRGPTV